MHRFDAARTQIRWNFFLLVFLAACSCSPEEKTSGRSCEASSAFCNGECVDLDNDTRHCGICGNACGGEERCIEGRCMTQTQCEDDFIVCNSYCRNPKQDPAHCGGCGIACAEGQICDEGHCVDAGPCDPPRERCGQSCTSLASDPKHCGACNHACSSDETCEQGACVPLECAAGETACDSSCVDTDTDRLHCGACGHTCADGEICAGGRCSSFTCPAGQQACAGHCVDIETDPEHCGGCNQACVGDEDNRTAVCVGGRCESACADGFESCEAPGTLSCETYLYGNTAHCGACNHDCNALPNVRGAFCLGGVCELDCKEGWMACDFTRAGCTTDVRSNPAHCGACNRSCGSLPHVASTACENENCVIKSCEPGWLDCDGAPGNGCEVDLQGNINHCGACGKQCSRYCHLGTCDRLLQVAGGFEHSCALTSVGTVACWGRNDKGQLGIGGGATSLSPEVIPGLSDVRQIAAGGKHSCALLHTGEVLCWGDNGAGQLGNIVTPSRRGLMGVALTKVVEIALGDQHGCARTGNGQVHCWGSNKEGQLGDGSFLDSSTPVQVPGLQAIAIATGPNHSCAVLTSGEVRCWGDNAFGQLGSPETSADNAPVPVAVKDLSSVRSLALGARHGCALLSNGEVRCWGDNTYGQIGSGGGAESRVPVAIEELEDVEELAAGQAHNCARLQGGEVHCWGYNALGQLGAGPDLDIWYATPLAAEGITNASQLAMGGYHSCALLADGALRCWGANGYGAVGNNDPEKKHCHSPTPIDW